MQSEQERNQADPPQQPGSVGTSGAVEEAAATSERESESESLPNTASPLPLFGLASVLALGGWGVLRATRSNN